MENIQKISLDIMDNQVYEYAYAKQYDEGRILRFTVSENGIPYNLNGVLATFQAKKPDDTVVLNSVSINDDTNVIDVELTLQTTILAGKVPYQIQLMKDDVVISTVTGYLKVDKSVVDVDDVESSDEFNALVDALVKTEELNVEITKAEEIRQSNEEIRKENEIIRNGNESERKKQEVIRQSNEENRVNAEQIRCQNEETRQSNETIRKSNEVNRQKDTANAIAKSNAATTDCINATTDLQNKLNEHYFLLSSDKGIAGGVAELDEAGLIPSSQLPSYVDDVIEGYYAGETFYQDEEYSEVITGETGKIYIDLVTNKTYRWSGTAFAVISETLALGETSSTAYRGDRGKIAYEHALSDHARIDATKTEKSEENGNLKINEEEITVYTHPDSGATADSYGDSFDQAPIPGGTFKVPYMTVDAMGHVTEISEHTVTLPTTSIIVDDALSAESTNPVENRVVTQAINQLLNSVYPIGSIYMSVNATNPSSLFGGTWVAWGSGQVPVGVNTSDSDFNTVEKTGGAKTHTLTTAQLPSHTHTFTGSAVTSGNQSANHTHSVTAKGTVASGGSHYHGFNSRIDWTDTYNTTNTLGTSGGILTVVGGNGLAGVDRPVDHNTSTHSGHSHTFTGSAVTSGSNSASHTHSVTAKGTNSSTGSGSAHNNLQPYITCYMWKRTA